MVLRQYLHVLRKEQTMPSYSLDLKHEVVEFYKENSLKDTTEKYNVSVNAVCSWYNKITGERKKPSYKIHSLDLIHCACQYYTHHTWWQTCEAFNISQATLYKWRDDYGYPRKIQNRNLSKDKTPDDVSQLHAKAMWEANKQVDAYRDKMRELEGLVDNLRSDASSIQNKMFDFLESLKEGE